MKLSFDDTESFKEAAGSLRFNIPPSDPNTSSMPPQLGPQGPEISEDRPVLEQLSQTKNVPGSAGDAVDSVQRVW